MGYLIVISIYLILLVSVSIYRARLVKSQADIMVAGRGTKTYMLVGTLLCTWIGSGSIIAAAGLAYRNGISVLWMTGGAVGGILCIYFLAGRVRKLAEYTIPDLLELRYNAAARLLGSFCVIVASTTIVGYQLKGGAMVMNISAGIPMETGTLLMGVFIILFTSVGGMMSIVAMDVLNGIVIILGIFIALPLVYVGVGGMEAITLNLPADHFTIFGDKDVWWAVGVFFPVFFLLLGESTIYQKFFSAKDPKAARQSVIWWVVGTFVLEASIILLAVFASSYFRNLDDVETIIFYTAKHGAEISMPFWAGAMLLCASMAIIFSSANSFLLIPSSNITRDIYQRFINPSASEKKIVLFQRLSVIALGIAAYLLITQFETVLQMAFTAYTMIGAGITPVLLAAFLWKRVTPPGGVASMLGGIIGTIFTKVFLNIDAEYIIYYALIPSVVLLVVVSLLTQPSPEEKWKPFITHEEGV